MPNSNNPGFSEIVSAPRSVLSAIEEVKRENSAPDLNTEEQPGDGKIVVGGMLFQEQNLDDYQKDKDVDDIEPIRDPSFMSDLPDNRVVFRPG